MDYNQFAIAFTECIKLLRDKAPDVEIYTILTSAQANDAAAQLDYLETEIYTLTRAAADLRQLSNRISAELHQDPSQLALFNT